MFCLFIYFDRVDVLSTTVIHYSCLYCLTYDFQKPIPKLSRAKQFARPKVCTLSYWETVIGPTYGDHCEILSLTSSGSLIRQRVSYTPVKRGCFGISNAGP